MQLFKTLALLATATTALAANTIKFKSQDSTARTVYFTPSEGSPQIQPVRVEGNAVVTKSIPIGWIGNYYSVCDGRPNVPGMLGEFTFNSRFEGITFFDVSAIVDPNDHVGVKMIMPAKGQHPVSGCEVFPCNNAYYHPDDVQTKATHESDFICLLGGAFGHSAPSSAPSSNDYNSDSDSDSDNEWDKRSLSLQTRSFPRAAVQGQYVKV